MRIDLEGIIKTYGGVRALRGVNLSLVPGEVHALLGENGAGKSTLIKVLTGIERPDSGTLRIGGQVSSFASPAAAVRAGIGTVYQDLNLCPNLDATSNLFLGHEPAGFGGGPDRVAMRRSAQQVFDDLGVKVPLGVPVGRLPVSLQQITAIARALTLEAKVLVFDEPTSALNRHETEALLELIRGLRARGLAVVYVTHKLFEVYAVADQVTILRDGANAASGPIRELAPADLTYAMLGQALENMYPPRRASRTGNAALKVQALHSTTLRGASLELRPGEVLGLAGIEGSGAAEVLRVLFGLEARTGGAVEVDGRPVSLGRPLDAIRAGLAFVPADRIGEGNFMYMSVSQNVLAVMHALGRSVAEGEAALVTRLLKLLNVRASATAQRISALSGGNQQKVIFARWLAAGPRVLLLDDPTRGVDVGAKAEIYRILRELSEQGVSVLFSSSDVAELVGLADRVVAVADGRCVAELEGTDLTEAGVLEAITSRPAPLPGGDGLERLTA